MPTAYVADRRLYLTADRLRLVEEGDPAGAFLFVAVGQPVTAEDAKRFGLTIEEGQLVLPAPAMPEAAPAPATKPAAAAKGKPKAGDA